MPGTATLLRRIATASRKPNSRQTGERRPGPTLVALAGAHVANEGGGIPCRQIGDGDPEKHTATLHGPIAWRFGSSFHGGSFSCNK
jgi:hypothetical protein